MKPSQELIKIKGNKEKIKKLLEELVLLPRLNAIKWSNITKQTPNIRIGYPGQHLASLITGMWGERLGARGNDLADGSEVKSCSRIDQLDVCKDCGLPVARIEDACSSCGSKNIIRKDDSKWLFTIKNEKDLETLLGEVNRVLLLIGDYPNFESGDYSTLRFQAFELWTKSPRNERFNELMTNYYHKIYLKHKKENSGSTPAPKNFWPYSYQFYLCNPILVFSCTVKDSDSSPKITVDHYVEPEKDRAKIESLLMPTDILYEEELDAVINKAKPEELKACTKKYKVLKGLSFRERKEALKFIDEKLRSYLPLRDTDRIATSKKEYKRRRLIK